MNDSTWNSTSSEVHPSTNLTTPFTSLDSLKVATVSFNLLLGLPTNCYIMWFIVTGRGGGFASEFFVFNLTVCETVFSINGLFFILAQASPTFLTLQRFSIGLAITGRPVFQCLICIERYLAVVRPVTFLKFKPLRYRVMCSAVAWFVGLGSCLFSMFSLILSKGVAFTWYYMIQFLVFLSVQMFCCVAVLRALRQSRPGERGEENNRKKRAFNLILITTVTMVIMFVPFILTGILSVFRQDTYVIWHLSFSCYVVSAFVLPVTYLHRNGKLNCFPKKLVT